MSRAANKRHNARRDENEPLIVEALRKAGALVDRIDGTGVPDLLVGYQERWALLEVKVPGKKPRLTTAEAAWHERAAGYPRRARRLDVAGRRGGAMICSGPISSWERLSW